MLILLLLQVHGSGRVSNVLVLVVVLENATVALNVVSYDLGPHLALVLEGDLRAEVVVGVLVRGAALYSVCIGHRVRLDSTDRARAAKGASRPCALLRLAAFPLHLLLQMLVMVSGCGDLRVPSALSALRSNRYYELLLAPRARHHLD